MLNNILINKLNNRDVILNNPNPKTSIGTKKLCRKRGKALNNKHPALNNRLNNILNNTATGLFNALNNKLINRAPRLFNMKELQGVVAGARAAEDRGSFAGCWENSPRLSCCEEP